MKLEALDPRVKLIILLCLSSAALLFHAAQMLLGLLWLALIILLSGGVKPLKLLYKARGVSYLIAGLFILQCLFNRSGEPVFVLAGKTVIYEAGLEAALSVCLRLLIIVLCALIVSTGQERDYLLALTQCKMPYEIAYMTLAALRFLPMLREEAQDILCAVQMRGIRLKKTGLRNRLRVYYSILLPVLSGALRRAEQLSTAMETRGFRAYPERTYMRRLRFKRFDYIYLSLFITMFAAVITAFLIID